MRIWAVLGLVAAGAAAHAESFRFEPLDAARVRQVARELVEVMRNAPARLRVARKLCVAERLRAAQGLSDRTDVVLAELLRARGREDDAEEARALREMASLRRRADWLRAEAAGCAHTPRAAPAVERTELVVEDALPPGADPTRAEPPPALTVRFPPPGRSGPLGMVAPPPPSRAADANR
jgi:hypothetical protein